MNAAVDTFVRRLSGSRRGKKGSLTRGGTLASSCGNPAATSIIAITNDVKLLRNALSKAGRGGGNMNDQRAANLNENLNKAPFHSPFEGTISLNMSAKESVNSPPPSHKGFLTIFQEESGLGAWNRRWCSIQDNKIYYWLYPEDQVNRNKVRYELLLAR
eukprot:sb/3472971/